MPREGKLYGDAVPVVGLIGCAVLAMSLAWPVMVTGGGVLIAGFIEDADVSSIQGACVLTPHGTLAGLPLRRPFSSSDEHGHTLEGVGRRGLRLVTGRW